MPDDDLVAPPFDRPSEPLQLDGHLCVGEVADDVVDPGGGEVGVGVVVCLADDLLSDNRPSGLGVSGVR